jgi:hypothetical protein
MSGVLTDSCYKGMSRWKTFLVGLTLVLLTVSFSIFLVTGYAALYWAWGRGNLEAALPYLPWARNFGIMALAGATSAVIILFSSDTFQIPPKIRLSLSILATLAICFFAEFRNEGKFYFKNLVHFFGPGTWIHDGLIHIVSPLGDFLYRMEYSHWNDFLMGPAIVSVLFSVVFLRICGAFANRRAIQLSGSPLELSSELPDALRFARILMNIGLFWFFIQAWAEKAGYVTNPHSNDELDLPFEFAGTVLGFWMARVLTKAFDLHPEKFRSTFFIDFLSSGVIGVLYTVIVGPFTEGAAGSVAHALWAAVPHSLDIHEYTSLQRHTRPFELLLLAGVMCWGLNRSANPGELTRLSSRYQEPDVDSRGNLPITVAKALTLMTGYLLIYGSMLSILESQLGWPLATLAAGLGVGTTALFLGRRAVFSRNDAVQIGHRVCRQ